MVQPRGYPAGSYSTLDPETQATVASQYATAELAQGMTAGALALSAIEASAFAVITRGYVAAAVCVLVGPIFIPFFVVPKFDWLFWGWFKAFLGFSFYQVIAAAFIFVFSKVLLGLLGAIGPITLANAFTVLPALVVTLFTCIYGLTKIPELTASILGGRSGTWVNPLGN